uniref:Uncharacterized protein n=1 Tax=Fagus sylvatica TaxID=28930 RepID=A0A2N9FE08_FAGSY
MEDPQAIMHIIGEEEEEEECGGDEFYEKIEAPKFVDLTAVEHYRLEHDDRFWFCLYVGQFEVQRLTAQPR